VGSGVSWLHPAARKRENSRGRVFTVGSCLARTVLAS
jgi:hypothetical protein